MEQKQEYLSEGNLKRKEDKIWNFFFQTDKKCFKKKHYSFHHMIETDGVSCSLLFLRNDMIGKRFKPPDNGHKDQYIDELKDYSHLADKNIIAIDPGLSDLLYCVDDDTRDRNFFRYTQDQRRKETKGKKYGEIILEQKQTIVEGKTIIDWETEISDFNRKTLDINEFKKYLKKKNEVNHKLFSFYKRHIFRKLKLNSYLNRQRSEQRLINRFTEIFGNPEETIVCFGDYEQRKHRKYKEPTKGKGFRDLFRRNGFKTYLVDEFRTSCKCSNCEGGDCVKFRRRRNPSPNKNNSILVHGALMCKTCRVLWNRDENGARNIYKIARNHIMERERPEYLTRSPTFVTLTIRKVATGVAVSGTASVGNCNPIKI